MVRSRGMGRMSWVVGALLGLTLLGATGCSADKSLGPRPIASRSVVSDAGVAQPDSGLGSSHSVSARTATPPPSGGNPLESDWVHGR